MSRSEKSIRDGGAPIPTFREFSLNDICEHATIILIAKRGSGKSWIVRALLHHYRSIPCGMIICPTEQQNGFYSKFFPSSFIHFDYRADIVDRVLARQNRMIEKLVEKQKQGKTFDARAFIVMDDCLAYKGKWARDQGLRVLMQNGRHFKLLYVLVMQFPLGIDPDVRANFDIVFLMQDHNLSNQKRIYDHYAGIFPSLNVFRSVFNQLTVNHGAMVIKNREGGPTITDTIFWYRSPDLTDVPVTIGNKQFHDFHNRNYDGNKAKPKLFDIDAYFTKNKNGPCKIRLEAIEPADSASKKRQSALRNWNAA